MGVSIMPGIGKPGVSVGGAVGGTSSNVGLGSTGGGGACPWAVGVGGTSGGGAGVSVGGTTTTGVTVGTACKGVGV
jgi:hypothetical protein